MTILKSIERFEVYDGKFHLGNLERPEGVKDWKFKTSLPFINSESIMLQFKEFRFREDRK